MADPKTIQEPTARLSRWYALFVLFSGTLMVGVGLWLVLWQLDNERERAIEGARVEMAQRAYTLELYLHPFERHLERTRGSVEGILNNPTSRTRVPWDRLTSLLKPPRRPGGRFFLVDDEPAIRKVVGIMLRNLGFEVLIAKNGIECLDLLATLEAPPEVILLDYSMPRLDGRDTLRQIRARRPGVPVILCSGYDAREMACDDEATADAYLQKPIRLEDLTAVIRDVL